MLSSSVMHWDFALIFFFLGAIVPWMGRRRMRHLMSMPSTSRLDRLSLYASTIAFQWVAAALVFWRAGSHGIRPADLGIAIPHPALTCTVAALLSLLILANQILSLRRISARPDELRGLISHLALKVFPQDAVERLAFLALVSTVALCEEVIYRGFVQFVFQNWGGVLFGILGSALIFGLAHIYQDKKGVASTFVIGALFSGIRSWTDTLIPSIVAHFLADLVVGLASPARVRLALEKSNALPDIGRRSHIHNVTYVVLYIW